MAVDRWNLVEEIFHGALELPVAERHNYLLNACGDDSELRFEVESLLANDREAATTLGSLVVSDLRAIVNESSAADIGSRFGPYKLVRELDSGGMGVVYLAVRSDDQYFQIVAIKVIRKGMESPGLLQRFRTERQILATLSHPNIGTILDGGETADGRPFIVMEFVEGQPITQACENLGLSIKRRIELFRSLCSAAHYAHQKLVIHRDIKPSNVLVTPDGVVKLIDFGISKPIAAGLIPGGSSSVATASWILTPDYASPEQLSGLELTTSTDIYSLGVLLYELLTGSRPYTLNGLSYAAAERLVCSGEIRKPSAVSELFDKTRKELAGDLDRIILMSMEKDPSRRYQSAQHLNEDLLRYLEGRPILARNPTPIYRLQKFVRRHRTASFMSCAMVVVIAGSVLFHSWQSRRADRKVKQVEAVTDSAITDLAERLQQSPTSVEVQASLFHSTLESLDQLRQNSLNDPRLLLSLSKAFGRVGDLEGSPYVANLGNLGTASKSYQESLRTALAAHSQMPGEESAQAVSEAYLRLCNLDSFLGNLQEADKDCRQDVLWSRQLWQQKPDDPLCAKSLAGSYIGLANMQLDNLAPDQARNTLQSGLDTLGNELSGIQDHDHTLIVLYWVLGRAVADSGPQLDALSTFHKSVDAAERAAHASPSSPQAKRDLFLTYYTITAPLTGQETLNIGDSKTSYFYARKALQIAESIAAADSKNAQGRQDLGFADEGVGDSLRLTQPRIAAGYYRKAIAIAKETPVSSREGREAQYLTAEREEELARVLVAKRDARERLALLEDANSIRKQLVSSGRGVPLDRLSLMRSYCKVSEARLAMNDLAKARLDADSCLQFFNEFRIGSPSLSVVRDIGFCYESLGNVHLRLAMDRSLPSAGRDAAAAAAHDWYGKSLDAWTEWDRRGTATPESELERQKLQRLLRNDRNGWSDAR